MGLNNPKWWYRILQIDRKQLVQCNLESAWGLAVAGCGNSDGLSEQSMEIVAVGLFGREVVDTRNYALGYGSCDGYLATAFPSFQSSVYCRVSCHAATTTR